MRISGIKTGLDVDSLRKPKQEGRMRASDEYSGRLHTEVDAAAESAADSLDLKVRSLATSQRVETGIFSSLNTALGLSGTVMIDGRAIAVTADDTLASIQSKIIAQNISATCLAVRLSKDQYKLVITSSAQGALTALGYTDSEISAICDAGTSDAAVAAAVEDGDTSADDSARDSAGLAMSVSDTQAALYQRYSRMQDQMGTINMVV